MNPERRFQVFVSSTYLDLVEERRAVISALLEANAFPAGMELFPAADVDAWTLIQRVIDESDYYLLVIGGRYGSVDSSSQLSFTEKEYDYAVSQQKPVMAFLHKQPDELPLKHSESSTLGQGALTKFRSKVEAQKHVKFWGTPDALAGQVALSFMHFTRNYPATGWVRADQVASADALQEVARARAEIDRLKAKLVHVETELPLGAEGLSRGDDMIITPMEVHVSIIRKNSFPAEASAWVHIESTWNQLLRISAPLLLDEADEDRLRSAFEDGLAFFHEDAINSQTEKSLDEGNGDWQGRKGFRVERVSMPDDALGSILLQFKAVGLIERSEKKRSIRDGGRHWTLTPYGETQAINVRALRKDTQPVWVGYPPDDSWDGPSSANSDPARQPGSPPTVDA